MAILIVGYIVMAAVMIFRGRWLAVGTWPTGDGYDGGGGCHMGSIGGGGHCH